jgi:two-component system CheB/CheR fusion protein
MHNGKVTARSSGPGEGSEFIVRLPLLTDMPPEIGEAAPVSARPAGRALRVVVVDDNVDAAESLALLLRCKGHEAFVAHEGRTALDLARSCKPDVILLDIGLPGLDGLEVCRRLRREAGLQQALLVAVSGYGKEEDRHHSQEAGFNAHLVKPVDLDQLDELLARAAARGSRES